MNLLKNSKIVLAIAAAATGTTTLTGTVDTAGFEGVMFVGKVATVNAGNFAKVGQGAASNGSDAADLAGSKATPAADGDSFAIDVYRPTKRYVTVSLVRAGATTVSGDVMAILYGPRKAPPSHGTTISAPVQLASPAEGTA